MNQAAISKSFSRFFFSACVPTSPCHPGNCALEEAASIYVHTGNVTHYITVEEYVCKVVCGFAESSGLCKEGVCGCLGMSS